MININVICSNGDRLWAGPRVGSTVLEFKELLFEYYPVNEQTLIYKRQTLEDHRTLDSYGIQDCHVIYMELPPNPWFTEIETTPPPDTTTGGEMIMIDMISSNMEMFSVSSSVGAKVADFKKLLARITYTPANEQWLVYRGITLEDDRTLDSYGVKEYHTIHMEVAQHRLTQGMPEMSVLLYLAISQMMRTLLSSPQLMSQIIGQNPQLSSMFDSNHELSDMIQNHEVVKSFLQVYTTSAHMMQAPVSQLKLPRQNSIRHSIPSEDAAAGPSTSFNAMGLIILAASILTVTWRICKKARAHPSPK